MSQVVVGSFLCGGLAVLQALYVTHGQFKRMQPARGLAGEFCSATGELLRRMGRQSKGWLLSVIALMAALLLLHAWKYSFWIFVGIIICTLVVSLGAAIHNAFAPSVPDSRDNWWKLRSRLLRGQMVTGCGLMSVSGVVLLAWLWDPIGKHVIGTPIVSFVLGGFVMCFVIRNTFLNEPPRSTKHDDVYRKTWGRSRKTWDAWLFTTYVATLAAATFLAESISDADSRIVALPLLTGSMGLVACIAGHFWVSCKRFERIAPLKARCFSAGLTLVIGGGGLYVVVWHFQSLPLVKECCQGTEAALLASAFAGMSLVVLTVLITEVLAWKYPASPEPIATKPKVKRAVGVQRVMVAACMVALPFTVGSLGPFTGYYLLQGVQGPLFARYFGITLTAVGIMALGGIAYGADSEDQCSAFEKLFVLPAAVAASISLLTEYIQAVSTLSRLAVPAVKSGSSDLLIKVTAYAIVFGGAVFFFVLLVLFIVELVRDTVSRYRRMG